MRRSLFACFLAWTTGALAVPAAIEPAQAQEPLLLRIRPADDASRDLGGGSGATSDDEARQARARNEAVWARAERRSRMAIASVCTGCLAPVRPPVERSPPPAEPIPPPPSPFAQTGAP